MQQCELVPGRGIRLGNTDIFFGARRAALRQVLGYSAPQGDAMWDDEDEYTDASGADWLRLRFMDDKLCDIEVLGGSLVHQQVELKNTDIRTLTEQLHGLGMELEPTEWLAEGRDCIDLQIVVATRDDIGEVGDEVEWVTTSSDFRVE